MHLGVCWDNMMRPEKKRVIHYLRKKFISYKARYTLFDRTCCAMTRVAQKLRHYLSAYTTHLISRMDPLKYRFQKAMPTRKLAKWQMSLSEFEIMYMIQKAIKGQALDFTLLKTQYMKDMNCLEHISRMKRYCCWGRYIRIISWVDNVF